jgi:PTS system ascorbate-specific IIC component
MNAVLSVLLDIFRQPAAIVGLIALVGLLLQKKSFSDVMKGTIKTFVGFLVLAAGAGVVVKALDPFGAMFQHAFGVQGVVPNNEAIVGTVLAQYGSAAALIFFFGMIVNVILARFTQFKFIYLSGHVALYLAAMIAVILAVSGFGTVETIIWGAIAQGLITTISPALIQPWMRRVTGKDNVALGHTGGFGIAVAGLVGKLFGNDKKSTEDLKFPKGLGFLRDTTVVIAVSMGIIYLIVTFVAGAAYVESEQSEGQNFVIWAIMQAGGFAAGVFIILAGVRVVLAEIVPAFKGISERLVPNAKPALDVPIVFTFAPNAVLIGFLSSFVGGIAGMGIMAVAGGTIIIPGIVAHFMTGGASGVIGNATGGIRGSVLGAFTNGLLITFLPLLLLPVLGEVGFSSSTFSDADFGVSGLFLGSLASTGGQAAIIVGIIAALAATFAASVILAKKNARTTAAAASEAAPANAGN